MVLIYADVFCNLLLMDRCSLLFQQACDDFSDPFAKFYFEADDNDDGNPECMWNSRTSSYCNPYDACTNYPTESKCKTDDECSWKRSAAVEPGSRQASSPVNLVERYCSSWP